MQRIMKQGLSIALIALFAVPAAFAQQKLGYIDSEYILGKLPDYATVQQNLDRMAQDWQKEIEDKQREVDDLFREYQARELLYVAEERKRRRDDIIRQEEEVEKLRAQYFGPEGELFQQQENLMRPLQERILTAMEEVATSEGYDYVFDISGDYLFLYAREQLNLSDRVLEELGIDLEKNNRTSGG